MTTLYPVIPVISIDGVNLYIQEDTVRRYFEPIARTCYLCGKSENETRLGCKFESGPKIVKGNTTISYAGFTYLCREHGISFFDCITGEPFIANGDKTLAWRTVNHRHLINLRQISGVYNLKMERIDE